MESACNREQFGYTQCGGFGSIYVLTIVALLCLIKQWCIIIMTLLCIHASIVFHACSVCVCKFVFLCLVQHSGM